MGRDVVGYITWRHCTISAYFDWQSVRSRSISKATMSVKHVCTLMLALSLACSPGRSLFVLYGNVHRFDLEKASDLTVRDNLCVASVMFADMSPRHNAYVVVCNDVRFMQIRILPIKPEYMELI